jgi:hypothetical protein
MDWGFGKDGEDPFDDFDTFQDYWYTDDIETWYDAAEDFVSSKEFDNAKEAREREEEWDRFEDLILQDDQFDRKAEYYLPRFFSKRDVISIFNSPLYAERTTKAGLHPLYINPSRPFVLKREFKHVNDCDGECGKRCPYRVTTNLLKVMIAVNPIMVAEKFNLLEQRNWKTTADLSRFTQIFNLGNVQVDNAPNITHNDAPLMIEEGIKHPKNPDAEYVELREKYDDLHAKMEEVLETLRKVKAELKQKSSELRQGEHLTEQKAVQLDKLNKSAAEARSRLEKLEADALTREAKIEAAAEKHAALLLAQNQQKKFTEDLKADLSRQMQPLILSKGEFEKHINDTRAQAKNQAKNLNKKFAEKNKRDFMVKAPPVETSDDPLGAEQISKDAEALKASAPGGFTLELPDPNQVARALTNLEGRNKQTEIITRPPKDLTGIVIYRGPPTKLGWLAAVQSEDIYGFALQTNWELKVCDTKIENPKFMNLHVAFDILSDIESELEISCLWSSRSGSLNYAPLKDFQVTHYVAKVEADFAVVKFEGAFPYVKINSLYQKDFGHMFGTQMTLTRWDKNSPTSFSSSSSNARIIDFGDGFVRIGSFVNTSSGVCGAPMMFNGAAYGFHYKTKGDNMGVLAVGYSPELFANLIPLGNETPESGGVGFQGINDLIPSSNTQRVIDPILELEFSPEKCKYHFENWTYVGHTRFGFRPLKEKELTQSVLLSHLELKHPLLFEMAGHYTRSRATRRMYEKSVKKGDLKKKLPSGRAFLLAKQVTFDLLYYFYGCKPTSEYKVNTGAGAGVAANARGKPKKQDVMDDPESFFEILSNFYFMIYGVEDKDELLSKYDVDVRQKLRTYFAGCFYGITWQKFLYTEQNDAMKSRFGSDWIQYGYVKQFGGYAQMIARLNPFNLKWAMDISGWDRAFPFLEVVYEIRNFFLTKSMERLVDPESLKKFNYLMTEVTSDIVNHRVILKDGSIWIKDVGNPSGSNNTTEDNCIGHVLLDAYIFIKLYQKLHHGELPKTKKIKKYCLALIYGDDDLCGVNTHKFLGVEPSEALEALEEVIDTALTKCGFEKKFLHTEVGFGPIKTVQEGGQLEFLGSLPLETKYGILPKPNISHLAASLTTNMKSFTPTSTISKIRAAVDLCSLGADYDTECKLVVDFCKDACTYLWSQKETLDLEPTDEQFLLLNATGNYKTRTLVTGFESGPNRTSARNPFSFFLGSRHKVDIRRNKYAVTARTLQLTDKMSSKKRNTGSNKVRTLEQQLARERNKVKQLQARTKVNQKMVSLAGSGSSDCHEFTMSMLDPEHYGPFRYPDEFSEPTSIYKAINNFNLPILVNDDPDNITFQEIDPSSYWAEITPSFDDTITYLTYENGRQMMGHVSIGAQSNLFGLKPFNGDQPYYPPASNLALHPDSQAYLSLPISTADGVLQRSRRTSIGFENINPFSAELTFFWEAAGFGVGTSTIHIDFHKTVDGTPVLVNTQSFNVTVGTTGSFAWTSVAGNDSLRPGYGTALSMRNESTGGAGCPITFKVLGSWPLQGFAFEAERLSDISTLQADVEKYRFTAQSALCTYMGNVLTMAGQCSSLLYRGGVPSQFNQVWDLETLAVHKQAYSGPTVEGTYTYWEPQDTGDMVFESIYSDNIFKRPYILCAGLVNQNSDDVQSYDNLIRLRVISHIEFTTKSQLNESVASEVRPDLIVCRALVLRNVPNSMENGKHLQKLKQIGSKVFNAAKKAAGFLYSHKVEIAQVAEILAPLMMA